MFFDVARLTSDIPFWFSFLKASTQPPFPVALRSTRDRPARRGTIDMKRLRPKGIIPVLESDLPARANQVVYRLLCGATRVLRWLSYSTVALFFTGCVSWQGRDGARYTLVVGFGIISQKGNVNGPQITDTRTIGLAARIASEPQALTIGYQHRHEVLIPKDWEGNFSYTNAPVIKLQLASGE
jgi:hypothetical protein